MIRRETEDGWILFNQHDHAKLAAEIMEYWGNDEFSRFTPESEVMFAIEQHDNGWKEWDSSPRVNPGNSYPMNFMEMNIEDQHRIWSTCFTRYCDTHPYASALIALHFRKFSCKSVTKDPHNGKAEEMIRTINRFVKDTLGLEDIDNVEELPEEVKTNLRFLQIGDIISLTLCHGWRSMELARVPLNYEQQFRDLSLDSGDGAEYGISPNPFSEDTLEFTIPGRRIDRRTFSNDNELRKVLENTEYENFSYIIRKL